MAFELKNVVPWGRNLAEYRQMFALTEADLQKKILSVGDGPASFNAEMKEAQKSVVSLDPVYQFSAAQLEQRIEETKTIVLEQTRKNATNFVWKHIRDIVELEDIRMRAMQRFLTDFEQGKAEKRYVAHALPEATDFAVQSFDLGLSSHFLLLYDQLGLDFHLQALSEMLRLCAEIRIFPLLNLDAQTSSVLEGILCHFSQDYRLEIINVDYEFQKNGNQMLRITGTA